MRRLKYLLLLLFLVPCFVFASAGDKINNIDVKITLDNYGNAHITEIWDVYAGSGTEFYKAEYNLQNMEITNFQVIDETNRTYTFIDDWDIEASLSEKAYKNGFNYTSDGLELCWGKSSYGSHKFTISYDVSNFVFNTNDAQVLYWSIINEMEMMPDTFSAVVTGPNYFSDTLDVWGYGYKGYAYVYDGKIMMSNEENTDLSVGDYAVLLVKFPLNTFAVNSSNTYTDFNTFDDVYEMAEENTFEYDYDDTTLIQKIFNFIGSLIGPLIWIIIIVAIFRGNKKYKFGEAGSKINMKEINMFRDIPCKKDIFRAYFISQAYKLNSNETDFFGSIFLKWLFEGKIELKTVESKKLLGKTKEETSIILKENLTFDTEVEKTLYSYLVSASKDNILEKNEFTKWSKNNYNKLFKWFDRAETYGRSMYSSAGLVTKKGSKYIISDTVKKDAIELAGLKKYLIEFSRIKEKQAIEVMLWKEYLMYSQIFGIADKVAEQFSKLYPEVITEVTDDIDISDVIFINNFSHAAVVSASTARSQAQSYSSGGGGFSSGGGGGGSFGGGGGGGR